MTNIASVFLILSVLGVLNLILKGIGYYETNIAIFKKDGIYIIYRRYIKDPIFENQVYKQTYMKKIINLKKNKIDNGGPF